MEKSTPEPAVARDASARPRSFRWGFLSASAVVLAVVVVGHLVCDMLAGLARDLEQGAFAARHAVFLAFLLSTSVLLWLQRAAARRFLLDVHAGVALVGWATVAVAAGVLVPQMEGFEDQTNRITPADYEAQYQRFADAEAYFLYHLTHLYGIGVPEGTPPTGLEDRLELYGRKYGREEERNQRKQMDRAFAAGPKRQEIEAFKTRHEGFLRGFFRVATVLHLNRAYKSYWFATLMGLVGLSVFLNLFRSRGQRWLTLKKAGFAVTHIGVVLMLGGGLWSKVHEDRGILQLFRGNPPARDYWRYFDPQKIGRLPFWVRLEHFARLDWKTLEIGFADADISTRLPTYTLWPGREIELDYTDDGAGGLRPRVRLRVVELSEHARVERFRLRESRGPEDPGSLGPTAVLDVPDFAAMFRASQQGASREEQLALRARAFLAPDLSGNATFYGPAWSVVPAWDYRLRALRAEELPLAGDALDLAALFPREEHLAYLLVRELGAGDVEPARLPVRLGQTLEVHGGYRLTIAEANPHYQTDPETGAELPGGAALADQVPWNPALWVEIEPPGGGEVERRLVLEAVDTEGSAQQSEYACPDLLLQLEWERWSSPGPPRYVLAWGRGAQAVLIDEEGRTTPVAAGDVLALPGAGNPAQEVRVAELYADARRETEITFLPRRVGADGFDESFYSDDPRGLELEITREPGTPEESVEVVRLATAGRSGASLANHWVAPDQRFYVHFYENDRAFPFEWRSVLSIYELDPEGRWHVFSGATGELLRTLSRDEAEEQALRFGADVLPVADLDRDGQPDFIGPVREVDLGPPRAREIRVNDYFTYRGFRFFQTNADPRDPRYSGIGVVYDPGIPTVLFGMYTIILGTVLAFIVRPIVEAGRQRRRTA